MNPGNDFADRSDLPPKAIISLRIATANDLPSLYKICRESFPGSALWATNSGGAKKWWEGAIASKSCEVWVAVRSQYVVGFTVLVLDELQWAHDMPMQSEFMSRVKRGLSLMITPRVLIRKIIELRYAKANFPPDKDGRSFPQHERLFAELIAVTKMARGKGIGRSMEDFQLTRAAELGLKAVYFRVDRSNKRLISHRRSIGYRIISVNAKSFMFSQAVK
ncbi:MAG: hypothetical protein IIB77_06430 [Proteobacteria bacterium]|nr:hypothetical protein [Pseudomonadota bacterium]